MNRHKKIILFFILIANLSTIFLHAAQNRPISMNADEYPTLKEAFTTCGRYDLQEFLNEKLQEFDEINNAIKDNNDDNEEISQSSQIFAQMNYATAAAEAEVFKTLAPDETFHLKFCRILQHIISSNLTLENELTDPLACLYYQIYGSPYDYPVDHDFNFVLKTDMMKPIMAHHINICDQTYNFGKRGADKQIANIKRTLKDISYYHANEPMKQKSNYFAEEAIKMNHAEVVKLLKRLGCLHNDTNNKNLISAIYNNADKVFLTLLSDDPAIRSGQLTFKDNNGYTLLSYAIAYTADKVLPLLVEAGADIHAVDKYNRTYLSYALDGPKLESIAVMNGSIIPFLIACQVNIAGTVHLAASKNNPTVLRLLLATNKVVINEADADGNTALHLAGIHECKEIIPLLIAAGANLTAKNHVGQTPWAAAKSENIRKLIKPTVIPREESWSEIIGLHGTAKIIGRLTGINQCKDNSNLDDSYSKEE